jgi:hypothetical protein
VAAPTGKTHKDDGENETEQAEPADDPELGVVIDVVVEDRREQGA